MKLGILGGSFNPIHYGHLRIAEEVREKLKFQKIIFVPSYSPPLKTEGIADAGHRFEMTRLAVESNPFFKISDIECRRGGKSYTIETLTALKCEYPGDDLYFILGIDSFMEIPLWHEPKKIMEAANFVVVSRPGSRFLGLLPSLPDETDMLSRLDNKGAEMHKSSIKSGRTLYLLNVTPMHLSATDLRGFVRAGTSIKYLLPENVESYIISNKLYLTAVTSNE